LTDFMRHPVIDVTIDGADEADKDLNLIKGGFIFLLFFIVYFIFFLFIIYIIFVLMFLIVLQIIRWCMSNSRKGCCIQCKEIHCRR